MGLHLVSVSHLETMPTERAKAAVRAETVARMAAILVTAAGTEGLDLGDDVDVIDCLRSTHEQYPARVVLDHLDDALLEARQAILSVEFAR